MKKCLLFHSFELRIQKGVYDYSECSRCGTRKYHKRLGYLGYSAVDWKWLMDSPNPLYTSDHGPH